MASTRCPTWPASFDAVPALLGGQVDAVGAFRNFEPILLGLDGVPTVFFPFEDHGVPSSWQLVFVAGEAALAQKGEAIGRFLEAVARAVAFTLKDPNRALDDFFAQNPALAADDQRELNIRSALATLLLYEGAPCHDDAATWTRLQDFVFERGLIDAKSPLEALFTAERLPASCA
mgnify:CR=1 FL=1